MAMKADELDPQVVEFLIKQVKTADDIFGNSGVMMELKKALTERILEGELTTELGYEKHTAQGKNTGNSRNGHTSKTLKTKPQDLHALWKYFTYLINNHQHEMAVAVIECHTLYRKHGYLPYSISQAALDSALDYYLSIAGSVKDSNSASAEKPIPKLLIADVQGAMLAALTAIEVAPEVIETILPFHL